MNTITFLLKYWHINVTATLIVVIMISFHYISNGNKLTTKSTRFFAGVIMFILVTFSPIDFLARHYLFSAHMVQHIVLLLIVPPLLLTGTDKTFLNNMLGKGFFRKMINILCFPLIAWILGVGSMWVMHAPAIMLDMSHSPYMMNSQMIILPVLGWFFIWPVYTPVSFRKLDPLLSSVYLFLACVGCTVLGILITFAPAGMFMAGMNSPDQEIANLISNGWGISTRTDQMLGGLIMWVPACIIYLTNVMIILLRWFTSKSTEDSNGNLN